MFTSGNRSIRLRSALAMVVACGSAGGCQEETYKVGRGEQAEAAKPADPKAADRIEKASKAEEKIFAKSAKLR
ncbi:hypothetical protein [Aquisphaera insulae]|uniref:hypothetical protein n=1 Tax=Aquisphaera insulae TaxID=2712864 RepID=UPI0013EA956A|nr:hypothetical protein [Aquisphaera insulae]